MTEMTVEQNVCAESLFQPSAALTAMNKGLDESGGQINDDILCNIRYINDRIHFS